jgi:repressor LexA
VKGLTQRQEQILKFVGSYGRQHGFPPSVREIGARFELNPATVYEHLRALERKGHLHRKPNQSRSMVPAAAPDPTASTTSVPVIGRVAAGTPILAEENIEDRLDLPEPWVPAGSFLLRIQGDSMRDAHILDGDYVLIRPQPTADNGDIVVALIDEEATLKRYYRTPDRIELRPENPDFQTITLEASEGRRVAILGRVAGVFRI